MHGELHNSPEVHVPLQRIPSSFVPKATAAVYQSADVNKGDPKADPKADLTGRTSAY
jgi:hypothetical protein